MVEVEVVDFPDNEKPIVSSVSKSLPQPSQSGFITSEQLDVKMNNLAGTIADKLQSKSALTSEAQSLLKGYKEMSTLKEELKDPTTRGMEQSMTDFTSGLLGRALENLTGTAQQAVAESPSLGTRLAQIAVNNLTGESSPLPGILAGISEILGQDRIQKGYDAGLQYVENQNKQGQSSIADTILRLDENNQEHVVYFAELMGYGDINRAQAGLVQEKNRLRVEIEEMQRIQQGGTQESQPQVAVQQLQVVEQQVVQQEVVQQEVQQEVVEQPDEILISQPSVKPMNEVNVIEDKEDMDENDIAEIAEELGE